MPAAPASAWPASVRSSPPSPTASAPSSAPLSECSGVSKADHDRPFRRQNGERGSVLAEVEEAVGLVAEGDGGGAEGVAPVAPDRGIGLLHPVVGDEHERG